MVTPIILVNKNIFFPNKLIILSPYTFIRKLMIKNLNPLPNIDINRKLKKFIPKKPLVIEIILKGRGVKAPKKTINDP